MVHKINKQKRRGREKPPSSDSIIVANRRILEIIEIPAAYASSTCWSCKRIKSAPLEKAHIEPFSRGGSNSPDNYLLLCNHCHQSQPDGAPVEYQIEWLTKRPQFWESKFEPSPFQTEFKRMSGIEIESFCDLIIERHGTKKLESIFKTTLRGGVMDKAGMTTGNAMANAVYAFIRMYRAEYMRM